MRGVPPSRDGTLLGLSGLVPNALVIVEGHRLTVVAEDLQTAFGVVALHLGND